MQQPMTASARPTTHNPRAAIRAAVWGLTCACALLAAPASAGPPLRPPDPQGRPGKAIEIVDPSQAALDPWFKAVKRAARGKGQARIAFYGASHTAADLWTGELRRILQDHYGDAGHGFVFPAKWHAGYRHQDINVDASKGWAVDRYKTTNPDLSGDYGLAGLTMTSADPADFALVRTTEDNPHGRRVGQIDVWVRGSPQGGDLLVDIDGTVHVVATRDTESRVRKLGWRVPDGGHAVRIAPAGTGPVTVYGLAFDRRQPGVILDQLGIPGMNAEVMLHWSEDTWRAMLNDRRPDLVVFAYGTNAVGDEGQPIDAYLDTWRKVLTRLREARPTAACLLVGPTDRLSKEADGTRRPMARTPAVIAASRQAAEELGCGWWDAVAAMGGPGSMIEWQKAGLGTSDDVHLTRKGYPWMAELFHYALMKDYGVTRKKPAAHKQKHAPVHSNARPAKKAKRPAAKGHR